MNKILDLVLKTLDDAKAFDIVSIDVQGKTSLTDYLVVASGTSSRHVLALAESLVEKMKECKIPVAFEGKGGLGDWVVVDVGEVMIHIFRPEIRSIYEIEELWGITVPGDKK